MEKKIGPLLTKYIIILLAIAVFSLNVGRYHVTMIDIANILLNKVGLVSWNIEASVEKEVVFWNIRVTRVILASCVGCALSVSGAVLQSLFRNPLASPDIIGVTQGASFGAALALMFLPPVTAVVQGTSFVFGFIAVMISFFLAGKVRDNGIAVLVLIGIILSSLFQAGLSLLIYLSDPYDQMQKIMYWIMGSLQVASWKTVTSSVPVIIAGTIFFVLFSWRLNIMSQSDEEAVSLGVNIVKWRYLYIFVMTAVVSASVSVCGNISWIGLIVPHIARLIVGPEHKKLIPVTAVLGAIFLLFIDTIVRSITAGELPISIVTSLIGAPFLGYLVLGRKKEGGG